MNSNRNLIIAAVIAVVLIAGYYAYVNTQVAPQAETQTQQ
jgi:lipopolysaccharide export LptBFGC system permease protein LptF